MALMKLTAFNGGIRGKINGTVFQYCPYGQVVKGGLTDVISAGAKLTKADAGRLMPMPRYLTTLSSAWKSLTDAQRLTWSAAASSFPFTNRWGDSYTPSGFLLYMRTNLNLLKISFPEVHTAPAPDVIVPAGPGVIVLDAMSGNFNLNSYTSSATHITLIWATGQISPGAVPKPSQFKFIYQCTNAEVFPFNLYSFYVDALGPYPTHGNVWFKLTNVNVNTGQSGNPYFIQVTY